MEKLVSGVRKFLDEVYTPKKDDYKELAKGQSPEVLFITCSDSRVDPTGLTSSKPGDLFVIENAGNIVPTYGMAIGGEGVAATVEYAVVGLKVKHIVVCGHAYCGAMGGLLNPDALSSMPCVAKWLQHAEATRRIIDENYKDVSDDAERLRAAVQENVLVQLENLRTHPSVAAALARKELQLHGWVYAFDEGQVSAYDPGKGAFVELSEAAAALATS